MKLYIAIHKETREPYRPAHTRYSKSCQGTVRAYTTPGRATMAMGRRASQYQVLEVETEALKEA